MLFNVHELTMNSRALLTVFNGNKDNKYCKYL